MQANDELFLPCSLQPGSLFTWLEDSRIVVKLGTIRNGGCMQLHAVMRRCDTFIDTRSYDVRSDREIIVEIPCVK